MHILINKYHNIVNKYDNKNNYNNTEKKIIPTRKAFELI